MKKPSFFPVLVGTGFGSGFSPFAPGTAGALLATLIWLGLSFIVSEACLIWLTVAFILWPHGTQKVLGWFGGAGWEGTYRAFTEKMGIPPFLAKVAMLTEFFAPICLVLGIFTRIAALSVIILMAVAMTKHVKNGYFSNWSGKKAGEGVEFHLLYAGSAFALFLTGPGPWSVDAWCMNIVHVIFG